VASKQVYDHTVGHGDQENHGLSRAAPGEIIEEVARKLAQREDEDQLEEQLEW
jgi:hypothetical protein